MAVIDNAIQALFKMAHWELIWENASPTSSFGAQSIDVDLTDAKLMLIGFRWSTTNGEQIEVLTDLKENVGKRSYAFFPGTISTSGSYIIIHQRTITFNDERITFSDDALKAADSTTPVVSSTYTIPTYVKISK